MEKQRERRREKERERGEREKRKADCRAGWTDVARAWLVNDDEPPNRKPINRSKHRGQTNLQSASFEFDQAVIRLASGQ